MKLIVDISCRGVEETLRAYLEEGQELVVGRENKDILLQEDRTLSRRHFSLRFSGDMIEVSHHSSTNPTLISDFETNSFRQVRGTDTERESCRIIAGKHRFVASLESFESATVSGDINEIWSDYADDEDLSGSLDSFEIAPQAQLRSPELTAREIPEPAYGKQGSEKPVFTWDDEATTSKKPKPKTTVTPKPALGSSEPKRSKEDMLPSETIKQPPRSNGDRKVKPDKPPARLKDDSFSDDFFD